MHSSHFCSITIGLLLASSIPTHSMDYQLTPLQDQALQIVLLNSLQWHDFEGVSHIIQKTPIQPNNTVTQMLNDKMSTPSFETKKIDYCYELFKYASAARHFKVARFLKNKNLYMHIFFFARMKDDFETVCKITRLPDWQVIIDNYNDACKKDTSIIQAP